MVWGLVTGGEDFSDEALPDLRACDVLVAVDGGAQRLLDRGLDFAHWVGDGDSLNTDLSAFLRERECLVLDRDKDDSDTEAALKFAVARGANEVWLFGGSGGRMDHWFANCRLFDRYPDLTRWYTLFERGQRFSENAAFSFTPGQALSVLPLGHGPWRIRSQGLKWNLDGFDFRHSLSLSNRAVAEEVQFFVDSGTFLLLLPWEIP